MVENYIIHICLVENDIMCINTTQIRPTLRRSSFCHIDNISFAQTSTWVKERQNVAKMRQNVAKKGKKLCCCNPLMQFCAYGPPFYYPIFFLPTCLLPYFIFIFHCLFETQKSNPPPSPPIPCQPGPPLIGPNHVAPATPRYSHTHRMPPEAERRTPAASVRAPPVLLTWHLLRVTWRSLH